MVNNEGYKNLQGFQYACGKIVIPLIK